MKDIRLDDYIKQYCGNSYKTWLQVNKTMRTTHDMDAYADYTYWFDEENGLRIVFRFSIGD